MPRFLTAVWFGFILSVSIVTVAWNCFIHAQDIFDFDVVIFDVSSSYWCGIGTVGFPILFWKYQKLVQFAI